MARDFAASTQKVQWDNPNITMETTGFTMACWLKADVTSTAYYVFSYGDGGSGGNGRGAAIYKSENDTAYGFVFTGFSYGLATGSVTLGTNWHHVAWVRPTGSGSQTCTLYVDGASDGTAAEGITGPNSTDDIIIGGVIPNDQFSIASSFDGKVAECFLWDDDLSLNEIKGVMRGRGRSIRPGNLKFYAPLWGLQSPEPDYARLGITGTVTSATQFNHPPVGLFTPRYAASNWEAGADAATGQPAIKRMGGVAYGRPGVGFIGGKIW